MTEGKPGIRPTKRFQTSEIWRKEEKAKGNGNQKKKIRRRRIVVNSMKKENKIGRRGNEKARYKKKGKYVRRNS